MYQVKCSGGYEIRVIGKGEAGRCEIAKATAASDQIMHTGTYAECERWLADRSVKVLSLRSR